MPGPVGRALDTAVAIAKGMRVTMTYLLRPSITVKYPYEPATVKAGWRGPLFLRGMVGEREPAEGKRSVPPCSGTCPANVDARKQNALVAEKRYSEAYETVRDRNILPGVLGRICHHPCEGKCRRGAYDEPVGIKYLHRMAQERQFKSRRKPKKFKRKFDERVCVIGSGPAGLAAAYDLGKYGYRVTVLERHPEPGGMLMIGVPKYRLPRNVLLTEVGFLQSQGVDIHTGVEVGNDVTIEQLVNAFDAVIVAVGLQRSRGLNIAGADLPGVGLAIPFLAEVNTNGSTKIGEEVIVVGGGNVAVDVARSAVRIGAKQVKMVCLERREEMPAFTWEVEEAIEEGVRVYTSWGPKAVLGADRVEGLEVTACLSVFDDDGRFNPRFDESKTQSIKGDTLIFAIGQCGDIGFLADSEVEIDDRGRLVLDPATYQTTIPTVFACGEIVTGPSTCIGSIATGHEIADVVHRFLRGKNMRRRKPASVVGEYPDPQPIRLDMVEESRRRRHMLRRAPTERWGDFHEIDVGYDLQSGLAEAMRCLHCDTQACIGCGFCARACPDYCISVDRARPGKGRTVYEWQYDMEKCCFCGLCADACPTLTLSMSEEIRTASRSRDSFTYGKKLMQRKPRE